jgi:hypothetical protein
MLSKCQRHTLVTTISSEIHIVECGIPTMRSTLLLLVVADFVCGLSSAKRNNLKPRLANGLGNTPALGWNSWVLNHSLLLPAPP